MAADVTFASERDDAVLRSLGILYLICAKATDDELAPEELVQIFDRLTVHLLELHADGEEPAHPSQLRDDANEILQAAATEYRSVSDVDDLLALLDRHAKQLRDNLTIPGRERVLFDLIALAEADGTVSAAECDFVGATARTFEIPIEQARKNGGSR